MQTHTGTDEIIFIGLNPSAHDEAKSLRQQGNKVIFIGQGTTSDSITHGKQKYDLRMLSEVEAFVNTLGLSTEKNKKLVNLINTASSNIKDELGQFVVIFSQMEKRKSGPGRLVLSGHSVGNYFWGEHNGSLEIQKIKEIATALPVAAALIEDLHLSACYSGKERYLASWRSVFPNVSTIWAYSSSAPGTYSGAKKHLSIWNSATKGNKIKLDRSIAANTRKGKSVAVWSKFFGYQSKDSSAINDLISRINSAEHTFQSYFSGESAVYNTQTGQLRDYYNELQEIVGHELATPSQINQYRKRLETTIRLIYFTKSIRGKFSNHYAAELNSAYTTLGIAKPDYSKLTRKQCLAEIQKFEQAAANNAAPEVAKARELLVQGLKNLEKNYIPTSWI